ncbi:MAG: C10 family peptidase [Bacteroidales bacterium]|nr:C10 family peptidase [Bacteroidales bacterium]
MKKNIIILLLALLAVFQTSAKPVDANTALRVATTFLSAQSRTEIGTLNDISSQLPFNEFYLFTSENGFVIVAGDDCVRPILAYSLSNSFEVEMMPINIRLWLQSYEDQIAYYKSFQRSNSSSPFSADKQTDIVAAEWERLLNGEAAEGSKTIVGPLLQTTWNQSPYYNNLCPYDSDEEANAVTGCTATATAQVMKYWNHPTTGYGSHSYYTNDFGTLSANFGNTTYNWANMPNALSSSSTTAQLNAVGTLMFHVGVAVEMNYGVGGSSAATTNHGYIDYPSAENALVTYFKYSPALHSIHLEDYTEEQWASLLRNELDNNRPVIYTGYDPSGGHAFVCDGYNSSTGQFHFNWGWGGWCDGYYTIGYLNPASGGTGGNSTYTFNLSNSAIIGIQPNSNWNSGSVITATPNNSAYGSVTGGGTKLFGDTVTLKATANSGYRFVEWSDGYKYNPRQFIATGGNITMIAEFEPLSGDTLYYSSNHQLTSFGTGSNSDDAYWGIKLPASVLTNGHNLTKVQLFIPEAGSYDLTVYAGSTSNSVYTSTYNASASDEDQWCTITLSSPVTIDGTQPIWITFHNNGVAYPASLSYSSGNSDALLWGSSFGSIASSWNYSFMIRGIFQGPANVNQGDTLSYCADSSHVTNVGAGGSLYWGISFTPAQLAGHNTLEKVLLYINEAGSYTLNIYSGNDSLPVTLLRSQTYTLSNTNAYNECVLSSPLAISPNSHLWVTFHNSGINYPASACNYTGDYHSDWASTNGTSWAPLHQLSSSLVYSWMIKCVTSQTTAAADIVVGGPTELRAGEQYTFTATVTQSGYNVTWNLQGASPSTAYGTTATTSWNNAGTYNVIATATSGSIVIKDTLQVSVTYCGTITTFPYTMGFETNEDIICWDNYNSAGGTEWRQYYWTGGGSVSHNGTASLGSMLDNTSSYNWLISPQIAIPIAGTATLAWYDLIYAESGSGQIYQLLVSTNGTSWTPLQSINFNSGDDWNLRNADLSSYAGQTLQIAFRHYSPSDYTYVMVDDINISVEGVTYVDVIFTCNGNGSVQRAYAGASTGELCGSSDNIPAGFNASYKFIPASNAEVAHIYVNNTDYITSLQPDSDGSYTWNGVISTETSINAVFTIINYTVTATSADDAMGYVTGGGTYEKGSTATLTAVPNTGYRFVRWDNNVTDNPYSFVVNSNCSRVAYFEQMESIDIADGDISVDICPNPASRQTTVSLSGLCGDITLSLVDATGRVITHRTLSCNGDCTEKVNVAHLAKGVYFLRVTDNENNNIVRKLIVR